MSSEDPIDPSDDPQIEPTFSSGKKNGAARSKATVTKAKLTLLQQLVRFVLVVAFLVAAQLLTLSITSFGTYRYSNALMFFCVGLATFLLSAVILNRQIAAILTRAEPSRAEPSRAEPSRAEPSRLLSVAVAVPVTASLLTWIFLVIWESKVRGVAHPGQVSGRFLWEGLPFLAALVCVVATGRYFARLAAFKWAHVAAVFLALVFSLTTVEYTPVTSVQASATVYPRKKAFKPLAAELADWAQSAECQNAIKSVGDSKYFESIGSIDGNLVVLGFEEWAEGAKLVVSPYRLEGFVPPAILAAVSSDVQLVAITEAIHPKKRSKDAPLYLQVLLYRWPQKTLLASAELDIGRTADTPAYQVIPAAATALYKFLDTASDESADPDKLAYVHSFNVITDVADGQLLTSGYTDVKDGQSRAFADGAVFVVGVAGGAEVHGARFDYGQVVRIQKHTGVTLYGKPEPSDPVVMKSAVTIFGKQYGPGRITIPDSGIWPLPAAEPATSERNAPAATNDEPPPRIAKPAPASTPSAELPTTTHDNEPPVQPPVETLTRTWTDRSGKTVVAEFVDFTEGKVTIRRAKDGKEFAIPIERLSDADKGFVKKHAQRLQK